MAKPKIQVRPLTAARMDDMGTVTSHGWGNGCWCMHPRLTGKQSAELPGPGSERVRRKNAMTALARRKRAPGLLAYLDGEPVGWVAVAPRVELVRIAKSKATPPVDDVPVWVIPCITVVPEARGQGIAVALIRAAVAYAAKQGAEAVEAYPRAANARIEDDYAFFGTEKLFRKAGFAVVRKPIRGQPKGWVRRVAMRAEC